MILFCAVKPEVCEMNTTQGPSAILKDSAIVIAILSSLLYFWGVIGETVQLRALGIPPGLMPERSVQDYLVRGGLLALYVLLPTAVLVFIIDVARGRSITRYFADVQLQGSFYVVIIYFTVLLASVALVAVGALVTSGMNKESLLKVKGIRLTDNTKGLSKYEGLYLLRKNEKIYLFVDKFAREATFYMLSENEVKELVVSSSH
jgi:hypothetical protein